MAQPVKASPADSSYVAVALPAVMAEGVGTVEARVDGYAGGILGASGGGAGSSAAMAKRAVVLTYPESQLRDAVDRKDDRTRGRINKVLEAYCRPRVDKKSPDMAQLSEHIAQQFKEGQFCLGCALIQKYNMYHTEHMPAILGSVADFWISAEAKDIPAYFNVFMDRAEIIHAGESSDLFFIGLSQALRGKVAPILQTLAALRIHSADERNATLKAIRSVPVA